MRKIIVVFLIAIQLKSFAQQDILLKNKTIINKGLKDWIASYKNFILNDFILDNNNPSYLIKDTMDFYDTCVSKKYANPLLYVYNKSKTFAIDIIGDQANLVYKKGKFDFEDADDGGHLLLHNVKRKESYQIYYNSFSEYCEEAIWLTDSTFLLGFVLNNNGDRRPSLFFADIKKNELYLFENKNEKCIAIKKGYTSSIIKNLRAPKSFLKRK